jgi:PDGLE domain
MRRGMAFFLAGLAVTLVVAVVISQFASGNPDGLEYVAEQEGFIDSAEDHTLSDAPLADYGGESRTNLAIAGLAGVVVTLGIGYGVFWLAKAGKQDPAAHR